LTKKISRSHGHHIKDWEEIFLAAVYEEIQARSETYAYIQQKKVLASQYSALLKDAESVRQVKTVTISRLLDIFHLSKVINPKSSSWSTSPQDIMSGNPYPLWQDKDNEIHRLLWEHLEICIELCLAATKLADNDESKHFTGIARGMLDRSCQSDQFWWASRKPMWDINLIHMGLDDQHSALVNAYRAISTSGADGKVKSDFYNKLLRGRDIRDKIIDILFMP
jgi:hypothetical protein